MNNKKTIYLRPPLFSSNHIKEKVSCIRAHRERIFQVYWQERNGQVIFHNYGHGGAGWTFLFGAVHESIRQFERYAEHNAGVRKKAVCVIGAGCHGLLTALLLARKGYIVRIIAREVADIPSTKAAGFFFPRHRKCSNSEEIALFRSFGIESYRIYLQISNGQHPFLRNGASVMPAYYGLDIDPGFGPYHEEGLIAAPSKVAIDFGNGKSYEVMNYSTIFINTTQMMHELHRNVRELGIEILQEEVEAFENREESILFNCAGMGAKKLTDDKRIIPVQGHLITLKNQPFLDQLQYMINVKVTMNTAHGRPRDQLIYYAPKESGILGITFLRGQDSLTANQHEFDRLLERCQFFFGSSF